MRDLTIVKQGRMSSHNIGGAWAGLAMGLGLIWILAFVVLPWCQALPHIRPIMDKITEAHIDAGSYWYTQSEETARAQMYVRHAIRGK
jgi:hypothetical protein